MHALIVYAHPEPTSFSAALKDAAVAALTAGGHTVEVSDLYGEGFNPVAGRHDFTTIADAARFHYQTEQLHASRHAGFAADLRREQTRLMRADLLIVVCPLWWGGVPAIVKGWFDRVCAYGVAYADGKRFDQGYFVGRRGLLCLTTGGTPERFSPGNAYGPIAEVMYSVNRCILEYLGLEVMEPFVAYAAPRVDAATREQYLRAFAERVRAIADDPVWAEKRAKLAAAAEANRGSAAAGAAWATRA